MKYANTNTSSYDSPKQSKLSKYQKLETNIGFEAGTNRNLKTIAKLEKVRDILSMYIFILNFKVMQACLSSKTLHISKQIKFKPFVSKGYLRMFLV